MLDRLSPRPGARHRRKRVGRGPGSGKGKTCGTGVKGQGTRTGKKIKSWFEGGQMPLQQRLPKRGFTNFFRKSAEIVNVGELASFGDGASIDAEALVRQGLIRGNGSPVKLLGEGEAPRNLNVKIDRASASARAKIEAAGGKVEILG
jgi:large subunit ribosomal protein L15